MGSAPTEKRFLTRWIVASSAGWVLGVIVVILLANLQEWSHVGNAVYIGLGMGWTMGLAQWLVARKWFGATSRWMWASTVGITTPFLFADLVRMRELSSFVLAVLAAIGGFLSGLMQINSLHSHSGKADRWVVVSAVAWMCPALLLFVGVPRHPETALESVRNVSSIVLGGVVLGVITGRALVSLLSAQKSSASQ